MSDDNNQQPNDVTQVPDSSPAPVVTSNPDGNSLFKGQTAEEWYKSYQSSQSKLREKDNSLKDALAKKNEIETKYHGDKSEWDVAQTNLTTEQSLLQKSVETLQSRLAGFERRDNLRKIIGGSDAEGKPSKYQDLLPAFDAGVLVIQETLDGDNLTGFLDNALNFFKGVQTTSVARTISGAAPSAPNGGQPAGMTQQQMETKLTEMRLQGKVNTDEYKSLRTQYIELRKTKQE